MKNIIVVLALSLALIATAYSQEKRDFKITNKTGVTVTKIYASPTGKQSWGSNLISKGKIKNGGTYDIQIPVDVSNCSWDIKYHDSKGRNHIMKNINLCNQTVLNLEMQKTKTTKMTKNKSMKKQ